MPVVSVALYRQPDIWERYVYVVVAKQVQWSLSGYRTAYQIFILRSTARAWH